MVVAYIRVSTNKQDLEVQKRQIIKYSKEKCIKIDNFISIEMSSKKSAEKRLIKNLIENLGAGDLLITTEISRLGRNMFEVINLVLELHNKGVQICFLRQKELNNFNNPTFKLILSIYAYLAEMERDFISQRTKAGLDNARSKGKKIGRPKNSLSSYYDKDIKVIKYLIKNGNSIKNIWIKLGYNKHKSYGGFYAFCKNRYLI
ncbi:recombinase family protein [Campylobacter vicugnae]|uniref:recombinase family protein n=1 Tax=Campylobacter vicugnae TaxID=1660076 RepID=UPI00254EFB55|nr:recombinase family protein [Campylobacter ovis]MDL0105750.1 recombinase family protein [Campylobacter ovis]MDL0107230.1 recombinase family protein [Campylobacter ovis]